MKRSPVVLTLLPSLLFGCGEKEPADTPDPSDDTGEVEDTGEPCMRDTVHVNGDDTLLLYTELDNPGRWMAHCHILEHAELGMMTELIVEE